MHTVQEVKRIKRVGVEVTWRRDPKLLPMAVPSTFSPLLTRTCLIMQHIITW